VAVVVASMSADGIAVIDGTRVEESRIDVTDTTFSWVRSFVRERDAHFERAGGRTYLVLD